MEQNIKQSSEGLIKLFDDKKEFNIGEILSKTSFDVMEIIDILSELETAGIIKYISYEPNDLNNSTFEVSSSYLDFYNFKLHKNILNIKDKVEKERFERGYIDFSNYNINKLKKDFYNSLNSIEGVTGIDDIDLTFVDRNKFDADVCIKISPLLKEYKGGDYMKEIIPNLVLTLNSSDLVNNRIIESIDVKGIYINIKLSNNYLFSTLEQAKELGEKFGESDINKGESIVVDYSSPNTAKHLHAGHIRSTILGHVLSNLYSATGYFTHRTNHINDWGGFGYLIEGYQNWKDKLPKFDLENDMLFHIYTIYRLGEKAKSSKEEFLKLDEEKIIELKKYYGDFIDYENYTELFNEFLEKSKTRFSNLEKGNKQEVELWSNMVEWSMKDFNRFYDVLDIKQDYFVGESFYANMGKNLVKGLEEENKVVFYDEKIAEIDVNELDEKYKSGDIDDKIYISLKNEIIADIGCYVIKLPNFERFVVLKSDQSTIYATRDLAAIKYRAETFNPSRIIYEVGQEQEEHFDKLFKSGKQIGIDNIDFSHIYHGFYIDSETKKKLSSRDGASNVQMLISESIEYFRKKYDENDRGLSKDEIDKISHELAIGSIIFNDIKKDKKNPVLISNNIEETCKAFESSGGAYIVYSICRANSIISKYNKQIPEVNNFIDVNLEDIEKTLILEINRYPIIIQQASSSDNPAVLTEYLSNLARYYNSYYNSCPVLEGNNEYRIVITSLIGQILTNGMKICHIKVPERI